MDLETGSIEETTRRSITVVKQRVEGSQVCSPEDDVLAIEDPLSITVISDGDSACSQKPLVLTMRTPGNDRSLILGFLYSEGIIESANDVREIVFGRDNPDAAPTRATVTLRPGRTFLENKMERHFAMHSSCGVCGKVSAEQLALPANLKFSDRLSVHTAHIHDLPNRMRTKQATFDATGGLHAAALFNCNGDLLTTAEDIGRHNALDKVIGQGLMNPEILADANILCVSGRMSYEILQKAVIARLPIVAGIGAPSSLAVSIANDFNITLIGFVRNQSYNIYSAPERLRKHPLQ